MPRYYFLFYHRFYGMYLGHTKNSGPGSVISYKKVKKTISRYSLIEERMLYFSMLFDRTSTNIIIIKLR
jgi:hypothetical protein